MSTPNMGMTLPVDHGSSGTWDTILDQVFTVIDQHDHTTGKGVQIPTAALNVNAHLAMGSFAVKDALAFDLGPTTPASVSSFSSALFANSSDSNNLYYRNSSGVNVQITSGSTLNVSIVGGIGGDYSSVSALLSFDDATDSYWLQQQGSPRPWARVRVGDVDIYETAASITNRVRVQSPSGLAASYAMTLPAALGSQTEPLSVSSAGVMSLGKHGTYTLQLHGSIFQPTAGTPAYGAFVGTSGISASGAALNAVAPIPLRDSERITAVRFFVADSATGPTKVQGSIGNVVGSTGVPTNTNSTSVSAGTGANQTLQITGLTITATAGTAYLLQIATTTGTNFSACYMVEIDYDKP